MAAINSTEGCKILDHELSVAASGPREHADFSPYDWNGGTIMAICGEGYCVLASDTRLSTGFNIKSRNIKRAFQVAEKTFIACGGCHADVEALYSELKYLSTMYKFENGVDMNTEAAAQLVSNTLYYKRFFPYYALPIIAGIAQDGLGYCAGYDAVGSYIRSKEGYGVNGSAASVAMPILDNLLGTVGVSSGMKKKPKFTAEEAVEIVKDIFLTVGERDILCGDAIEIITILKDGENTFETFKLKAD